jgi:hypothetical protein
MWNAIFCRRCAGPNCSKNNESGPTPFGFRRARLSLGVFARQDGFIWSAGAVSVYAELFGLRAGSGSATRRAARRLAGGAADLSLPSLERLRTRPGAKRKSTVESRSFELRDWGFAQGRLARGNGAARTRPGVRPGRLSGHEHHWIYAHAHQAGTAHLAASFSEWIAKQLSSSPFPLP